MSTKNKLHELLAIEQDRKHKAAQAIGEAVGVFTKKDAQFDGMVKRYVTTEAEDNELIPDESKEMVSTTKDKLETVMEAVIAGIDAHVSKEETNSSNTAKAELKIGDTDFGILSATTLLALEGHLLKIKELYVAMPTLDNTRKWEFDTQKGFFRTEEEIKYRSVKRPKVILKYDATKEHPAQTELLYLDFQVGKYVTVYTSGKITPAQKSTLLKRIDDMIETVKIARAKANNVEANQVKIAKKLFDYINQGVF